MSQLKYLILKAKAKITKTVEMSGCYTCIKNMDLINKASFLIPLSQSPEILPLLFSKDSPFRTFKNYLFPVE